MMGHAPAEQTRQGKVAAQNVQHDHGFWMSACRQRLKMRDWQCTVLLLGWGVVTGEGNVTVQTFSIARRVVERSLDERKRVLLQPELLGQDCFAGGRKKSRPCRTDPGIESAAGSPPANADSSQRCGQQQRNWQHPRYY